VLEQNRWKWMLPGNQIGDRASSGAVAPSPIE
jgi:hypothetical protein